jgi:ribosomal protein S18 acetylase RimI-like enzyme
MEITYKSDITPTASQVIRLYNSAGLPRPTNDPERIQKMFDHSNLIVSAWDGDKLVGVARTITDWAWSSYLADLAVSPEYQQFGIGRQLLAITKQRVGEQSMILLLSVPGAVEYYPKVGFSKEDRSFIMHRTK